MRRIFLVAPLFLVAACSSSSSSSSSGEPGADGGSSPDVRPTFAPSTEVGAWGTSSYPALALDRTGRAAVARLDSSDPEFMLFDGTTWGDATKLSCCDGPFGLNLSVDRTNRFWVSDTTGGFVTFDVAEPGASAFHAAKTTTPVSGSYTFPSVTTLADGRVRYAITKENGTIGLFELDASLSSTTSLGDAGSYQADTSEVPLIAGGSDNGSTAVFWTSKIANGAYSGNEINFYQDGAGWDAPSAAPSGYDLVSFTVSDDGHALALWENQNLLAVSVRDPATRKFGAVTKLVARDYQPITVADAGSAPAWLEADGSFTVVVTQKSGIERFSIGADGTVGAPVPIESYDAPTGDAFIMPVDVAERGGARFVTWRTFGDSPAVDGAFVGTDGTWSDATSIAPIPAASAFRWSDDLSSDGRAIVLLEPLASTQTDFCATPSMSHYSPTLGWGNLPLEAFDGCVTGASAAIADDDSVSLLVEIGGQKDEKHVRHAIAR